MQDENNMEMMFRLQNFSIKAPAEHTINGKRYDAELQIMHTGFMGENAIISILFDAT